MSGLEKMEQQPQNQGQQRLVLDGGQYDPSAQFQGGGGGMQLQQTWALLEQIQRGGVSLDTIEPVACESLEQAREVAERLGLVLGMLKQIEPALNAAVMAQLGGQQQGSSALMQQFGAGGDAIGRVKTGLQMVLGNVRAHSQALRAYTRRVFDPQSVLMRDLMTGEDVAPPEGWSVEQMQAFTQGLVKQVDALDQTMRDVSGVVSMLDALKLDAQGGGGFGGGFEGGGFGGQGQQGLKVMPWGMEGYGQQQGLQVPKYDPLRELLGERQQRQPMLMVPSQGQDWAKVANALTFASAGQRTCVGIAAQLADTERVSRLRAWLLERRANRDEAKQAQDKLAALAVGPGRPLTVGMIEGALATLANEPGEGGALSVTLGLGHETFFTSLGVEGTLTFSFVMLDTGECQLALAKSVTLSGGLHLGSFAGIEGAYTVGSEASLRTSSPKATAGVLLHAIHSYRDGIIALAGEDYADTVRGLVPLGEAPEALDIEAYIYDVSSSVGVEVSLGAEAMGMGDRVDGSNSNVRFSSKSGGKKRKGGSGDGDAFSGGYEQTRTERTFIDAQGAKKEGAVESRTLSVNFAFPFFGLGDMSVGGSITSEEVTGDINSDNDGSYLGVSLSIVYDPQLQSEALTSDPKRLKSVADKAIDKGADTIADMLAKRAQDSALTSARHLMVMAGNALKTAATQADKAHWQMMFDKATEQSAKAGSAETFNKLKASFRNTKLVKWLKEAVGAASLKQQRSAQLGASFDWMFVYDGGGEGAEKELCLQYFRIQGGVGFQLSAELKAPTSVGTFSGEASVEAGKNEVVSESIGEDTLTYIKAMHNADPDKGEDAGRWATFKASNHDAIYRAMVNVIWNQGRGPDDGKAAKAYYNAIYEAMVADLRVEGVGVDGDRGAISSASVMAVMQRLDPAYMALLEGAMRAEVEAR